MRHQVTRELFCYWDKLRGERAAPERARFNPGEMRAILPDTFLIEVDADGIFPLRVAGARMNALWRTELKGTSFIDLWRKEDRLNAHAALMAVVEGVAPLVGGARIRAGDVGIDLEFLLLPLRHFGATHSRVLGVISPSREARWIGEAKVGPLEFLSMRIVETIDTADADRLRPSPGARPRPRLVVSNPEKL
jgi:hypothetical protein